jgi:hypothetical protein
MFDALRQRQVASITTGQIGVSHIERQALERDMACAKMPLTEAMR